MGMSIVYTHKIKLLPWLKIIAVRLSMKFKHIKENNQIKNLNKGSKKKSKSLIKLKFKSILLKGAYWR